MLKTYTKLIAVILISIIGYCPTFVISGSSANHLIDREIVDFKVSIPKLPEDWRLPTGEELSHIMRGQENLPFPDYLAMTKFSIDDDRYLDWVVLGVKKDKSQEGLLVYLSSIEKWHVVDTDPFQKEGKVDQRMSIEQCKGRVIIYYSALGRPGHMYLWDKAKKEFIKKVEKTEFE